MDAAIAILADRADEIERVGQVLAERSIAMVVASGSEELWEALCDRPCMGVAVSVGALVRLSEGGKKLLREIDQIIPVAKFKVGPNGIGVMSPTVGVGASLDAFVTACLERGVRRLRTSERHPKHLNVVLSGDGLFTSPEPSFTFDLSEGGCYAHTDGLWKAGDAIWVSFREHFRDFALEGTVKRVVPWGVPFQPMGLGIQFRDPGNPELKRLLRRLF